MTLPLVLARTTREAGLVSEVSRLERAIVTVDRELLSLRKEARLLADTEAVSAAHAVRRARLAQVIGEQTVWLEEHRAALVAELGALS